MSRYNTSLSPSVPSLSSLSYPGVGDNDIGLSQSHLSQTIPAPSTETEAIWSWSCNICNISNFKLVSRLEEHPHTPTSLKHVWTLFINWPCLYKVNNGAINLANVG